MSRSGIQLSVPKGFDAPQGSNGPIDWGQLERATVGDAALAHEVLGLFDTQAAGIGARIGDSPPDLAMLAHSLKGSARAIGAWQVADAAQQLESALGTSTDIAAAIRALKREIAAVRMTIAVHLRDR